MNRFDDFIHDSISKEDIPMPKNYHQRVSQTLSDLPEQPRKPQLRLMPRLTAAAASLVFVFLMVLPNASPAYAQALEDVPVIGALVEFFTIRHYTDADDRHELDIQVPAVSVPGGEEAAQQLNQDVTDLTNAVMEKFYQELDPNAYDSVHVSYEVVTNTPQWFTLKLMVEEVTASGNIQLRYYHIDRESGRYVTLGDLLTADGFTAVEQELRRQMTAHEDYDTTGVELLSQDQSFYFNADGDLVIVYDEAVIAPASLGNPEFVIPANVYQK